MQNNLFQAGKYFNICRSSSFIHLLKSCSTSSMHQNSQDNVTDKQLREELPDLPRGPLDAYRNKASFDWRRIKLSFETLDNIKLKNKIYNFMRTNPLFQHPNVSPTLDEERRITVKRMYAMYNENYLSMIKVAQDPSIVASESEAVFMFDSSLAVKISLTFRMFSNAIRGGGQPHHYHFVEAAENATLGGCFALTEIGHGSNTKGMRTTATYCPERKQFILHSPDFEAAKCWVGSLGKCATHAIVYAMLVSKGTNHGLHAFIVPLRHPQTLKPFPGVIIGDIGEKIGLNGVDNGFVMFNNYPLDLENQLDKLGGVDERGDYQTPFRDASKRFGASLGILSSGRVHITTLAANYLQKAIVIAVRYSAVRKQFGPDNGEEWPVLEYQQQQIRLLPYLASIFALRTFCNWFSHTHVNLTINGALGIEESGAAERGLEMHALSSAAKPVAGWLARDGIQNCREACGGHGYLKASGIGQLRNDNDANCTYEGENSLLLQQASNWLLALWPRRQELRPEDSPYGSLHFLKDADSTLAQKCEANTVEQLIEPESILKAYRWLTAYMLKNTYEKVTKLKREGKDNFQVKNDSQSYLAVNLAVIYAENYILNHFYKTSSAFKEPNTRKVLLKMVSLYGVWMLEKHLSTLYIGGYMSGNTGLLLREGVLQRCAELAPEAVALADSLAPPDFALNSVLGASDGEVYKNIQSNVMTYPGSMSRPDWWQDIVYWQTYVQSKL